MTELKLTVEDILSPVQQIILRHRHGGGDGARSVARNIEKNEIEVSFATAIQKEDCEFFLSSGLLYRGADNVIQRHVRLSWREYEDKRDPSDHGKVLSCERDRVLGGLIVYLALRNSIRLQAIKTIYHVYDGYGQLLYHHPVVETSFPAREEIEGLLHKKLSAIQKFFHSENLPTCSDEEKGKHNSNCDRCPTREHCTQRKNDLAQEERRVLAVLEPTTESDIPAVLPDICNMEGMS